MTGIQEVTVTVRPWTASKLSRLEKCVVVDNTPTMTVSAYRDDVRRQLADLCKRTLGLDLTVTHGIVVSFDRRYLSDQDAANAVLLVLERVFKLPERVVV